MDWMAQFDGYCERTDLTYWSEPLNAITNAAFLIAAAVMAWRVRGQRLPLAWLLIAILTAIGIGSYLFHTHATRWAAVADVAPIALYILVYIYLANRHYWTLSRVWSAVGALAFIPYAAALTPILSALPFFNISNAYWTVALLIAVYAVLLRTRLPETSRGLAIGAAILTVSITLRSVDEPLCEVIPMGTHLWWHILNGIMLGWMIEVYRAHAARTSLQA